MGTTDEQLDTQSRELLDEIDELKRMEREKRETARSTGEFHDLARAVDDKARHVFDLAQAEFAEGQEDSPVPSEQAEQHPGDWTETGRY